MTAMLPSAGLLHYSTLMNPGACVCSGACYLMGVITGTTHSILIFTLPFHGTNTIHHFLCDILPVLRLASASTFWGEVGNLAITIAFILTPFSLIIVSYACILVTILGVATFQGRSKSLLYLFLPPICGHALFLGQEPLPT